MTIEDCLDAALSAEHKRKLQINPEDTKLFTSLSKQLGKGVGLTDRQHSLLNRRLMPYSGQLRKLNIDFENSQDRLRIPLRTIDRSQYIKLVESNYSDDRVLPRFWPTHWIEIRFPFSRKMAAEIGNIHRELGAVQYERSTEDHKHRFGFSQRSLYVIINTLKEYDFKIDPELFELYEQSQELLDKPEQYLPGIFDGDILNCSPSGVNYMTETLGKPDKHNIVFYQDRSRQLGLNYVDPKLVNAGLSSFSTLSQKIVNRNKSRVFVNSREWSFSDIVASLLELERFPVLVISQNDDRDQAAETVKIFSNLFSEEEINSDLLTGSSVIDKNQKVVYHGSVHTIEGALLSTDWKPQATVSLGCSYQNPWITEYLNRCDLNIYWDTHKSLMMDSESTTLFTKGLETL